MDGSGRSITASQREIDLLTRLYPGFRTARALKPTARGEWSSKVTVADGAHQLWQNP